MQAFFSVFPAQAGMILHDASGYHQCMGIPRASGDDPNVRTIIPIATLYSPRKRG